MEPRTPLHRAVDRPAEVAPRQAVRVRLWAGARAAAGTGEVAVPAGPRVADVVAALGARHPALAPILSVSALLVDGRRVGPDEQVGPGEVLEVLPPFAGG